MGNSAWEAAAGRDAEELVGAGKPIVRVAVTTKLDSDVVTPAHKPQRRQWISF